jgi:hypothetical protein
LLFANVGLVVLMEQSGCLFAAMHLERHLQVSLMIACFFVLAVLLEPLVPMALEQRMQLESVLLLQR